MKEVRLSGKHGAGRFALIDDEDFEVVTSHIWHLSGEYARSPSGNLMHRLIMQPPDGMFTDHINGDGLDNRRENLRICTPAQNSQNSRAMKGKSYKGVTRAGYGTYRATFKNKSLGAFPTKDDAAEAYNQAAVEHYGEFANLNEVDKMRAAIYVRQSLDRERTELAIERQRAECEKLCINRDWQVDEIITDNSISASSHGRPGYEHLLELIKNHTVDVVVILRIDRLLRLNDELEALVSLSERTGVKVATIEGDVDLTTPQGRLIARILVSVARNEMEVKSARHKLANAQKAAQGKPHGSRRLYGYEDDLVTIRESEAAVLREMARRVMSGHSYPEVAAWANKNEHYTTTGSLWQGRSLKRVLMRQHYAGIREHLGTQYEGIWQPIFDRETWERLQLTIRLRSDTNSKYINKNAQYLLTGLAYCGKCGEPLTGVATFDGKPGVGPKRRAYICRKPQPGRYHGCGGTKRNADALDHFITEAVLYRLDTPELGKLLEAGEPNDELLKSLLADRQAQQLRLDSLVDDYATGILTRTQLTRAKATADGELQRIEDEITALNRQRHGLSVPVGQTLREAWDSAESDTWRRNLLGLVIKRVIVNNGQSKPFYFANGQRYRFDPSLIEIEWQA